jgi:hypoxanthine phosphoribosyltransferase
MTKIKEIYSAKQISDRIAELGAQISADYAQLEFPVIIGVLKGSYCFLSDLVRQIKLSQSMQIEFVHLSSYGAATVSSGVIQAPYLSLPNISNRHILIVEDIVESGQTAKFLIDYLNDQFKPASLKLAVLLDRRTHRVVSVEPDYIGFSIGGTFVVGYGFDYAQRYRELQYIGELNLNDQPQVANSSEK